MKKFEKIVAEVKEQLMGEELSLLELTNIMNSKGFAEEADYIEGNLDEIKQCGNIAFTYDTYESQYILLYVEITEMPGDDECDLAAYVKILDVCEI